MTVVTTGIGAILLAGFIWQVWLLGRDQSHFPKLNRMRVPVVLLCVSAVWLVVAVIGGIGFAAINLFAEGSGSRNDGMWDAVVASLKVLLICTALCLKTYFGPFVTSCVVASQVYYVHKYGELRMLPLLEAMLDWLFAFAPRWIEFAYAAVSLIYVACGAVYDSLFESAT